MDGGDFGRWLSRQFELQPLQQQLEFGLRFGVTGQQDRSTIGGRDFDVDHLHGGELLKHAARGQPGRLRSQLLGERDVQAVGQEGDEDVRFNPRFLLVVDRPDRKIAFEILEGFLDLRELDVVAPQLGGVAAGEIGAQQVAAFAATDLLELVAVETVGERRVLIVDLHLDEPPAGRILAARRAELHQQLFVRERHAGELFQPRPQPLELARAHRTFLGDAIRALGEHVQLAVLRQELDLHAGPGVLPGLEQQVLLQLRQAAFGRADQVVHRRISTAHLREASPPSGCRDP